MMVRSPRTEIAVPSFVVLKDNVFSPSAAQVMMRFLMDLMAFASLKETASFPWRVTFPKTVMVISFSPVLVTLRKEPDGWLTLNFLFLPGI